MGWIAASCKRSRFSQRAQFLVGRIANPSVPKANYELGRIGNPSCGLVAAIAALGSFFIPHPSRLHCLRVLRAV